MDTGEDTGFLGIDFLLVIVSMIVSNLKIDNIAFAWLAPDYLPPELWSRTKMTKALLILTTFAALSTILGKTSTGRISM